MDTLLPVAFPYIFPFYMIVLPSLLQGTCSSWLQIPQCNFFMVPNTPIFAGRKKKKSQGNFFLPFFKQLFAFLFVTQPSCMSQGYMMALIPLIAMPKDQYRQLALSLAKWRGVLWNITSSLKHHMPTETLEILLFWWATTATIQEFSFLKLEYNCLWKKRL